MKRLCIGLSLGIAGMCVLLQACGAYMSMMNSLPATGGSFKATNTMSVPVCKVTVFAADDPSVSYDNEHKYKVLIPAGGEGSVSYPVKKVDGGVPVEPEKMSMRVYGCKPGNFDQMDVGTELLTMETVNVHGSVAIR